MTTWSNRTKALTISRRDFEKICEVEGIKLTTEMNKMFDEFELKKLPHDVRRQIIINKFKRTENSDGEMAPKAG